MALSARPGKVKMPEPPSHGVVDIVSNPARRVEVDTSRLHVSKLITHSEGYKWTVDYYRNLVGGDNVLEDFDAFINNPSQQYQRVTGMVLRVSTPIDPVQNTDDKIFAFRGEGFVDNGVKPNYSDVFVAHVGDGRRIIFTVDETEMLSHLKNASYRIEYTARMELSSSIEVALNKKIVKEFVYSNEQLERTGNPLIEASLHEAMFEIDKKVNLLKAIYIDKFYDNTPDTIGVPGQTNPTHDPQVTGYMRFLGLTDLTEYNHPPFEYRRLNNIFTLLKKPNIDQLGFVAKKFGVVSTNVFYGKRSINNIAFSGYRYSVFSGDYRVTDTKKHYGSDATLVVQPKDVFKPVLAPNGMPYYLQVKTDPYVVSESFYGGIGESILEIELLRYIRGEEISISVVNELYEQLLTLPPLEFFYYTPLLITVMLYVGM